MRRVGEVRISGGREREVCVKRGVWLRSGVVEKSVGMLRRAFGGLVE